MLSTISQDIINRSIDIRENAVSDNYNEENDNQIHVRLHRTDDDNTILHDIKDALHESLFESMVKFINFFDSASTDIEGEFDDFSEDDSTAKDDSETTEDCEYCNLGSACCSEDNCIGNKEDLASRLAKTFEDLVNSTIGVQENPDHTTVITQDEDVKE
jgi:hypothetical protein